MRIIITADWHIGTDESYNQDVLKGCAEIGAFAAKHKIDAGIIAGDIFDSARPTPAMYALLGECIELCALPWLDVITGNHDASSTHVSLHAFDSSLYTRQDVRMHTRPEVVNAGDAIMMLIPYQVSADFGLDASQQIAAFLQDATMQRVGKPVFVITHTDIPGAVYGAEREVELGAVGTLPVVRGVQGIIAGHIHRYQAGKLGGVPYFYSGSIARVDHGEEKEQKGFVVLDTHTMQHEFIPRKTARVWGTVNIRWNGKLPTIKSRADVLRVNIVADSKYMGGLNRAVIERELAQSKAGRIVHLYIDYDRTTQSAEAKKVSKGLSLESYEAAWIRANAKGHAKEVQSVLHKVVPRIGTPQEARAYQGLTLHSFELKNYQSITSGKKVLGDHDCIGILGEVEGTLSQSNGGGKSSVIEGIRWVLFGVTRYSTNASAIRDGADEMSGTVILQTAQHGHVAIRRTQTRKSSTCEITNEKGDILAKGKECREWVERNFGLTLRTFDALVYIGRDRHSITGARPSERLKMLQEPLPLERYTKVGLEAVKDLRQKNRDEISRCQGIVDEYAGSLLEDKDEERLRERIAALEQESDVLRKQRDALNKQMQRIAEMSKHKARAEALQQELRTLQREIAAADKRMQSLAEVDVSSIEIQKAAAEQQYSELQKQHSALSAQLAVAREAVHRNGGRYCALQDLKGKAVCPVCNQVLPAEHLKQHTAELLCALKESEAQVQELLNRQAALELQVSTATDSLRRAEAALQNARTVAQERKHIETQKSNLQRKLQAAEQELRSVNTTLRRYTDVQNVSMPQVSKQVSQVSSQLEAVADSLQELRTQVSVHDQAAAKLALAQQRLKKAERRNAVLNICYEACSVRGIAQYIVSSVLEEVNRVIPRVISEFGFWQDVQVELRANSEDNAVAVFARIGEVWREFEGLSAGEREIVNFVVIMAYRRVLENLIDIKYSFVMVDEALDVLDAANLRAAINYFRRSANMQSLCISHSDLKDTFTQTIIVAKDSTGKAIIR